MKKKNNTKIFLIILGILLIISLTILISLNFTGNAIFGSYSFRTQNVTILGKYSGFYDFPYRFFTESKVSKSQVLKIMDGQYLALKDMHNGKFPYNFTKIEYQSDVYGMTTPYGIKIGDSAFPSLNQGNPRWAVMAHEQGHNFFGGTSYFYIQLATPYPFMQESFAVLSACYTYNYLLSNQKRLQIINSSLQSLNFDFNNEENYQRQMYEQYISQGKKFNISDVLTSQALDYKMISYGNLYGWSNYKKFAYFFSNDVSHLFTFQNDGVSDVEQSTYVVASLNIAFNKDFRQEFRNLNFPINDTFYQEIYSRLKTAYPK